MGTTYSAVSTIDNHGRPIVLKNSQGENLTASAIYFRPDGSIVVGNEAKDMMQNAGAEVAVFFKRFMGDKNFSYVVNGNHYTATDLSAILLKKLRLDAEQSLAGPVRNAVITVPAYFNDLQRNETIRAAEQAGLNVLRIINEPTAAAITYGVDQQTGSRLLVYDLGGGTFDVTVLEVCNGTMRVLSTGGDHKLGGKDWDDCIVNYVADLFKIEYGCDLLDDPETFNELSFMAETAKKQLSTTHKAIIKIWYSGCQGRYTITRDMFESLTARLMQNTQQKTEEVLKAANLTWPELKGVLLVGGSTKMSKVSRWVREMSGKEPLKGVDVDEAVCIGAGIQAAIDMQTHARHFGLPGNSGTNRFALPKHIIDIQDVTSHSLGAVAISQDGDKYVNSIIIPLNTSIPVTKTRPFKLTVRHPEQEMEIYLTQGESTDILECTIVGYYVIRNMMPMDGEAIINVGYTYDKNGIIIVNASQQAGNRAIPLTVEKRELVGDMNWLYQKPKRSGKQLCVYMSIDLSGSMFWDDRILRAREAAIEFVRNIDLNCAKVAVSGFSNKQKVFVGPTDDIRDLVITIERDLDINKALGRGNEADPVSFCYHEMECQKDDTKCVMIILTDGYWDKRPCKSAIKCSDVCRKKGIDIIGIGIGEADEGFLKRISTVSAMKDLDDLVESFGTIAQELSTGGSVTSISLK